LIVVVSEGNKMDKNLKDAKANLGEAKDEIKVMIDEHLDAAKKNISGHIDGASEATKGVIVDMAHSVGKAAESVAEKFSKSEAAPLATPEPVVKK
jgi:hypothetical protein